jgi:hypothetical protein
MLKSNTAIDPSVPVNFISALLIKLSSEAIMVKFKQLYGGRPFLHSAFYLISYKFIGTPVD